MHEFFTDGSNLAALVTLALAGLIFASNISGGLRPLLTRLNPFAKSAQPPPGPADLSPALAGIHQEIVNALAQRDYSEVEDLLKLCHDYEEAHTTTIPFPAPA